MKNWLRNLLLLAGTLVLCYYTSVYFGSLYDSFTPGSIDSGALIGTPRAWQEIIGFPFAYIFFIPLLFKLFGAGKINNWITWLLAPALLFFAASDLKYLYLPIALGLLGYGLALLLRKIFRFSTNRQ